MPTMRACIGSRLGRLGVEATRGRRGFERREPARRARLRRRWSRTRADARRAACAFGGVAAFGGRRFGRRRAASSRASLSQALELEALEERRAAPRRRRACVHELRRLDRQRAHRVLTVSSLRALRQPVERRAQILADHAADLAGMRDHVVERAVLREPLRRGLRADLVHAGHVVDRVADQRQVVDDVLGRHAELGHARPPRRASRWSSC